MATQNIQIRIDTAVESAESARSLGQIRRSLLDIQNLQQQIGDESSPEFQRLAAAAQSATTRLAGTREAIGDIQDRVRTLDGSPVERMTNSFQLLREAIFNLDFDKLKIAFDGLKTSLLSNPIFLIAAAIAAITAAIATVLASMGLLGPVLESIGAAFEKLQQALRDFSDLLGFTANAENKRAEEILAIYEKRKVAIDNEINLRKTAFGIIENLSEKEREDYLKTLGIQLDGIETTSQLEIANMKLRYEANGKALQELETQRRIAEGKGLKLSEENSKKLAELWAADAKLWDEYQTAKVAAVAEANEKIVDLDNQLSTLRINNMSSETARKKAQIEEERQAALKKLDEDIKIVEAGKKVFENEAELRDQINRDANRKLREVNAAAAKAERDRRKADAQNELDEFDQKYKLLILKTEEGSEQRYTVETEYYQKRVQLLDKYQEDLGLSNVQIEIAVEESNDKQLASRKTYYQNDLNEFERVWRARIDREEEGSTRRLELERTYLQEKLTLYQKNYRDLGLSEEEFLTFSAQTQRKIIDLGSQLSEEFNFDAGVLLTQTSIKLQMDKLGEMLGDPEALTPYEEYVQNVSNIIIRGGSVFQSLVEMGFEGVKEFTDKQRDDVVQQLELITKTYFEQGQAMASLQANNARALANAYKLNLERSAAEIDQTLNYDDLLRKNREYYDQLLQMQKSANLQQSDLQKQQYAEYVIKQRELLDASVKAVEAQYDAQTEEGRKYLEKLRAEGNTEEEIAYDKAARINELQQVYRQSREEQENIHNAAMLSLQIEQTEKEIAIQKDAARRKSQIRQEEQKEAFDLTKQGLGAILNLSKVVNLAQLKGAKGNKEEEEKLLRRQFETEKAFNVGMALINGFQSILAITTVPDFTLGIANGIRIAAQVALNAATVAGILSQEFDSPNTSGLSTPSAATPTLQPNRPPSQMFEPANFYGLGGMQLAGGGGMGPQRVYVVETDITETQNRVSVIEQRAIF